MALTLLAVHAHPDDECITTGGLLARYGADGVYTVVVTCTGGEAGEISDPALATPETLPAVRQAELEQACRLLGVRESVLLGYRDSGMMGTEENLAPDCFWQANMEEATGRLVALVRRLRPEVSVTYNERGDYGHPDHITAHRIARAAYLASPDPARYPDTESPPWQPLKLYYSAWPRSRFRAMARRLAEAGIHDLAEGDESAEQIAVPDETISTAIDVSAYVAVKERALLAHRTQMGPDSFFFRLPEDFRHDLWSVEHFCLAESRVPISLPESDLFAGLR